LAALDSDATSHINSATVSFAVSFVITDYAYSQIICFKLCKLFMALHGCNGQQAAWAAQEYHGHHVLPEILMDDLKLT
jgi:hypothetical protein